MIEQQGVNLAGVPSSVINASINNLVSNNSLNLGEIPNNTIMTIKYREGGGSDTNVQAGELTTILNSSEDISVNNPEPASGGTDGQTVQEIKENAEFPSERITKLRTDLIDEELSELRIAIKNKNIREDWDWANIKSAVAGNPKDSLVSSSPISELE